MVLHSHGITHLFLLYSWLDPLLFLGAKQELKQDDLYAHPLETDSGSLLARFNWQVIPLSYKFLNHKFKIGIGRKS